MCSAYAQSGAMVSASANPDSDNTGSAPTLQSRWHPRRHDILDRPVAVRVGDLADIHATMVDIQNSLAAVPRDAHPLLYDGYGAERQWTH